MPQYDKLPGNEQEASSELSVSPNPGFHRNRWILRWIVETTLLGVLYLVFFIVWDLSAMTGAPQAEPSGYTRLIPTLRRPPHRVITFQRELSLEGYSSAATDAWDSLMPKGRGFILVEKGSVEGLKPGIPVTTNLERYALSSFHQLHCVAIAREAFYELKLGTAANQHHNHSTRAKNHHDDTEHLDHCFDYLRQAIMCAADPAVEPANESGETVDGWGGQHLCRNWQDLFDFAVENRAYDKGGVLNSADVVNSGSSN